MTTLAGAKIKRHRLSFTPKLGRPRFALAHGVLPTTVQGWEEEGKRPESAAVVNRLAAQGIAQHADWYLPAVCVRCGLESDNAAVSRCAVADCPLRVAMVA